MRWGWIVLADLAIGFALGGSLDALAAVSNAGRVVGGALGGWLAAVRAGEAAEQR